MNKFVITVEDQDKKQKLEQFLKENNIASSIVTDDKEIFIYSSDLDARERELRNEITTVSKSIFENLVEDFFDIYAIAIKNNNAKLPHYLSISFGSEYDDNGGTDTVIEGVSFYDENKKEIEYDFTIEFGGNGWYDDDYTIDMALTEIIQDDMITSELEDMYWDTYIPIKRGV